MKKYVVSRQVLFSQIVTVEASSKTEALLKLEKLPYSSEPMDFLDTDYYEVLDEDSDWFEVFTTLEDGSTMTVATFHTLEEAKEYMKSDPKLMVDKWRGDVDDHTATIIKYHNDLIN
jgi:hypothetical protein